MLSRENNSIFNNKNIPLFFIGKFISLFGSSIYTFAMGLYVLRVTGSAISFSITLVFGVLPIIFFSPVAGIIADKYDRKVIVVLGDVLNGMLFFLVFLVSRSIGLELWLIYMSTFMTVVLGLLCDISLDAAKPNIVEKSNLMKVNSIGKIMYSASSILAPAIGGVIYSIIDIHSFLLINGISFIVAGISESLLDFNYNVESKESKPPKTRNSSFKSDLIDGVQYIKRSSVLVPLIQIFVLINLFLSLFITVPLPYILNNYYGFSSRLYGLVQCMFPVGLIVGAILINYVIKKVSYKNIIFMVCFFISFIIILMALPIIWLDGSLYVAVAICYSVLIFIAGVIIAMVDIPIMYILQSKVSGEYRGRVMSIVISLCKIVNPIAFILSGLFINNVSLWKFLLFGGLLYVLINIATIKDKRMVELNNI